MGEGPYLPGPWVEQKGIAIRLALAAGPRGVHSCAMADLYLRKLESERRQLWATCRLKGLAKGTAERQRIAEIEAAIAAHKGRPKD